MDNMQHCFVILIQILTWVYLANALCMRYVKHTPFHSTCAGIHCLLFLMNGMFDTSILFAFS